MKIIASLTAFFAFFTALWTSEPQTPEPPQKVQTVFITQNEYDEMWKKIESLEQKGMTKDALKVAEEILTKAKAENNGNQQVKAILHIMKYKQVVEENSDSLQMLFIQKEIENAKIPNKNILQSVQASMYWQYYNQHRWEIMNRTKVEGDGKNLDYKTWDAQSFMEQIQTLFLASLNQREGLQKENVSNYLDILQREKNSESPKYRPTLYDVLAHRALEFFQSTEYDIARPADAFTLPITQGFAPAAEFAALTFDEKDNLSRDLRTSQIYQQLLGFHLKNNNLPALMEADLSRLTWAKERVVANAGTNKNAAYLETLEKLAKQYEGNEVVADVNAVIAQEYNSTGDSYDAKVGDAHRFDKVKAMQICDAMLQKYPNAKGSGRCSDIRNQILTKSLDVKVEDVNVPNKPLRARISYRNVGKIYLRVIAATKELEKKLENKYGNERGRILANETALKSWEYNLPNLEKDYQTHSVEAKVSELAVGVYYVLVSDNAKFSTDNAAINATHFQVASVAFYQLRKNSETEIFFTDRESGQQLVDVEVTEFVYNYQKGKTEKGNTYRTDKNGQISFTRPANNSYNAYFEVKRGQEIYTTPGIYSYGYGENPVQVTNETHLFTDRQMYRPGQTIYFKAIMLQKEGEKVKILANHATDLIFRDVNYQEVARLSLKTNEYGTVSGTFTAPATGLTGNMTIEGENGSASFNVEEYKRPKFEVTFNDLKGAFELNEKVSTVGKAMGYAGNAIDGATVKYRVVRNVNYPYWYCYRWWQPQPYSPEVEIANGTTKTDADGAFTIDFTAVPDVTIAKADKPEFSYTVYADVVDITGETHAATQNVSLGYISLRAGLSIPSTLISSKIEKDSLSISTNNLNGTFEAAKGKVSIHRLTQPTQVFRNRRWERTDASLFTESEYRQAFPNDVWKDENDFRSWKKAEEVFALSFDTEKAKKYELAKLKGTKAGRYVAELLTQDKSGNEIKVIEYFIVKSENANTPVIPAVIEASLNKSTFEPGENASLSFLTSEANVYVNYRLMMGDKVLEQQMLTLTKGERKTLSIPIKEEYRGGLSIMAATICHNEFWNNTYALDVPCTNKELKVEWMTFRNKLLPGAKEEWRVKISGPKGEKVAAEMLATMYDASLDEFRANSFSFNVHPTRYSNHYFEAGQHFSYATGSLFEKDWNRFDSKAKYISFDRLNEFGFHFGEGGVFGGRPGRPRMTKMKESANASFDADGASSPPPPSSPVPLMTKSAAKDHGGERDKVAADSAAEPEAEETLGDKTVEKPKAGKKEVQVRKNLQETAFFFPTLMTNENGEVTFSFTMPEALTKWKFLGLAHTQDLQIGQLNDFTVTQKELMVMPNTPRFLRVGDKLALGCKVVNLSEKSRAGVIELKLTDAITGKDLTQDFKNYNWQQKFFMEKGQSQAITWDIEIPETVQAVIYQMVAESENIGDGEENALPVIPNRMLVTETMPLWVHAGKSKTFNFNNLLNSGNSTTLKHQNFSLEFTSNPDWYAVQSLPYLMEYPHECTEQVFSRYYANSLASHIANSSPKIKQVFDSWKNTP
ncbi:MAG: alpha-2-macroglobulin family protein, partial [Bacteroidia bacterium]